MTPRRLTYEHDGPVDIGDVLSTTRSDYLVVAARIMATRDGVQRWALGVVRYEAGEAPVTARKLQLRWFPRGKRRRSLRR